MGLGANLLVTQLAWTAGHKALNFLPEDWKNKISGKRSDGELKDFLINNRGTDIEEIDLFVDGQKIADFNGSKEPDPSNRYVSNTKGNQNWFYSIADDFRGGAGYTCMYLRVQGTETIMEIPCVNGSPRISMQVIQNESPTASNELVTTNRRVKPIVFKFSFPIAYLRIYGINESKGKAEDITKSKLRNKMDSVKQKIKDKIDSIKDKIDGADSDDIVYDSDINKGDQIRPRTIPTYSQVLSTLIQFPRQFGCYLYMGFGFSSIGVTCSIDITSQKDNMDCIWVDMTLVETMEFDFAKLTSSKVSDWKNVPSTNSANSVGKTTNDNAQSVS